MVTHENPGFRYSLEYDAHKFKLKDSTYLYTDVLYCRTGEIMARSRTSVEDLTTLQMALVGYQIEKDRVEEKIRQLQAKLKGKRVAIGGSESKTPHVRRELSPAARARIAAAQKKRWAEHRKRMAQAAKAQPKVQAAG
ncbi:MAG TPA: hypothetical protein VKX45_20875 [Bryobacteraceae bacterium]|jgi:hypothetical protein|nr:hypothetical protein [Bryobacteraceae bacterium]